MEIKHIILTGLAAVSLASCSDYLDVDAPSAIDKALVFNDDKEMSKALNSIYACLLSNDTYGQNYLSSLQLNSDVDMAKNSSEQASKNAYARFDCTSEGGEINKFWTQQYKTIEQANDFIYGVEHSKTFYLGVAPEERDATVMQMYGEAKCIRAMAYHDLVTYFGDIPFDFLTTTAREDVEVMPVHDRTAVCDSLIADLISVLDEGDLKPAAEVTIERCNKEFCQALIARIALTAGGYSLRPDTSNPDALGTMQRPQNYRDYYATAQKYAGEVIADGKHSLTKSYRQVFIDECNYDITNAADDAIFEIPFTKMGSGNIGYIHGPSSSLYNEHSVAPNIWGKTSGSVRVSRFYPYLFEDGDARRDYVVGYWNYTSKLVTLKDSKNKDYSVEMCYPQVLNDYTFHNNKWSKLWTQTALGDNTEGSTGINYPYMRYADVLLMFAEADNELNGPTAKAREAVEQVRARAFRDSDPSKITQYDASTKEAFLKTILNERACEFAGENMRWKDLVRNNLYAENIIYDFFRYYSMAESIGGSTTYFDKIQEHDGRGSYLDTYPVTVYYNGIPTDKTYQKEANPGDINKYPNTALDILTFYGGELTRLSTKPANSVQVDMCQWWNSDGMPKNEILYSFYGYIRGDKQGNGIHLVTTPGNTEPFDLDDIDARLAAGSLPAVRYILPYPSAALQRSAGAYKNYYGYK